MEQKRPLRILEIGCGSKPNVPIYAAERHPSRTIHYIGIDTNHAGVDDRWGIDDWHVTEEYHLEKLDFKNSQRLRRQLDRHLGDGRFDEIHWHMPYDTQFEKTKGKVLAALSERLNEEGSLFYTFQQHSPLIGVALDQPDFSHQAVSDAEIRKIHQKNHDAIQRTAAPAGLELKRYAVRAYRTIPEPGTEISLFGGLPPLFAKPVAIQPWFDGSEKNHTAIDRFVRTHSGYAGYAAHFLELVKKAAPADAKVRRRK